MPKVNTHQILVQSVVIIFNNNNGVVRILEDRGFVDKNPD